MLTVIFDCAFNEHNLDSDSEHIFPSAAPENRESHLFIARLDDN